MAVNHEEVDVVIINQALPLAKQGLTVHVLCDDTDAFAFLAHFYYAGNISAWSQPIGQGLPSTLLHKDITPHILSLKALTGCGIASSNFGKKPLNFQLRMYASQFRNPASLYSMYFIRSNLFIANCYGSKAHVFMSEVRFNIGKAKKWPK